MSEGYIYILSNPSMPGLIKIGRSVHGGWRRAKEINQTGVPTPFILEFEMLTKNHEDIEGNVHEVLSNNRESDNREFFRVDIEQAIAEVISAISGRYIMTLETKSVDDITIHEIANRLSSISNPVSSSVVAEAIYYIDNDALFRAVSHVNHLRRTRNTRSSRFMEVNKANG